MENILKYHYNCLYIVHNKLLNRCEELENNVRSNAFTNYVDFLGIDHQFYNLHDLKKVLDERTSLFQHLHEILDELPKRVITIFNSGFMTEVKSEYKPSLICIYEQLVEVIDLYQSVKVPHPLLLLIQTKYSPFPHNYNFSEYFQLCSEQFQNDLNSMKSKIQKIFNVFYTGDIECETRHNEFFFRLDPDTIVFIIGKTLVDLFQDTGHARTQGLNGGSVIFQILPLPRAFDSA